MHRISTLRVFDPACGSGNFLVIAYKELRHLECEILKKEMELTGNYTKEMFNVIPLSNFYGIEIDDFAAETAKLSLWIAEYQMNKVLEETFGLMRPLLPLRENANIVCGNALRLDWEEVCPKKEGFTTVVCGNPPFLGFGGRDQTQQNDIDKLFLGEIKGFKLLDYVSAWFLKAAYVLTNGSASSAAFVATSSVCQGYSAATLIPHIFKMGCEITFAHKPFAWQNKASKNAAVSCCVIGIRPANDIQKRTVFSSSEARSVKNINAYLIDHPMPHVSKRSKPQSGIKMVNGNAPKDDGNLILNPTEKGELLEQFPEAAKLIRPFVGSNEFIRNRQRYCLWIEGNQLDFATSIPSVANRINAVRYTREKSKKLSTRSLADYPHKFGEVRKSEFGNTIIVPSVSSENREYLPVGALNFDAIVSNLAFAIYDAPTWNLSLVASKLHRTWIGTVCGKLEDRIRYSNTLGWNTFPVPDLTSEDKANLEATAEGILLARAEHPDKTIADLYDPERMADNLRKAHRQNDETLEKIYIGRTFRNDSERLEHLFDRYAKMIEAEKEAQA